VSRRVVETDVLVVGSGITAALLAAKLAERTRARITVLEAGDHTTPLGDRARERQRFLDYGANPWVRDHIDGYEVEGIQSRSMCVGGLAMHWGGVTPRFTPEDFRLRSLYGVGDDWPITYEELDPYYLEAEQRMGVAGEAGPKELDARTKPFPLPALPLSPDLQWLRDLAGRAGIPMWSQPSAKNSIAYQGRAQCCRNDTCAPVCPIGAKYSPDFTWNALLARNRITLTPRTLVRRLVPEATGGRISHALAVSRDAPETPIEYRAKTFVVAGGYVWTSHLLLLSADTRFPRGLANSSGLVGKYLAGHRSVNGYIRFSQRMFPGMNGQHSLVTTKFMRPGPLERYVRHDFRMWESSFEQDPRLRGDDGTLLLGDDILADWRKRSTAGVARVRGYYDVLPARESELTLDPARRNAFGDPLPKLTFRDSDVSRELRAHSEASIRGVFDEVARAGGGTVLNARGSSFQDHPAGGCRMGKDPASSVCDSYARTHDHENLFVPGAPSSVSASCANGTLTFVALALRSADALIRDHA
jgi:glucose dehydrogenase